MSTPNWTQWLDSVWGPSWDGIPFGSLPAEASNVVVGTNPPYTIQDFLSIYPKFGGPVLSPAPQATATLNSNVVAVSPGGLNGIAVGNPIADSAGLFADGTVVTQIGTDSLTLSSNANAAGVTSLTVWNAPLIPFIVLSAYIALASACLVQARWLEMWPIAMALFIAHYATLFLQSDGSGASTASQAASQGISAGIRIQKAVGDVSVGYESVKGIESWGAYNLTSYGQQFVTLAKGIGNGPLFLF